MKNRTSKRALGRPRAFDSDRALDRALQVFWRQGYEGTSLSDLTRVMGINRPSLYAAFGDKEALFRKVLDHYANGPANYLVKAIEEPSARAVAQRILEGAVGAKSARSPRGCLYVQGALACGEEGACVQHELVLRRAAGLTLLRRRFARARAEGDLPSDADPSALARYILTVAQGMSVQAAGGASRTDLKRVADTAMQAWPTDH